MTHIVTNDTATYVALTIATVDVPPSADGQHPPGQHLAGVGLLVARVDDNRKWTFAVRACTIAAGTAEAALLAWLADRLPTEAFLISWNVDHDLMRPLLEAACEAPPAVAHHFTVRLARVMRGGVIDLALGHGGAAAPPFAEIATDRAIFAPALNAKDIASDWATGMTDRLRDDLASRALALWRVFVRQAGLTGLDAEIATDAWARRGARLRAVERAPARPDRRAEESGNRG